MSRESHHLVSAIRNTADRLRFKQRRRRQHRRDLCGAGGSKQNRPGGDLHVAASCRDAAAGGFVSAVVASTDPYCILCRKRQRRRRRRQRQTGTPETIRSSAVLRGRKWTGRLLTWRLDPSNINDADAFIVRNTLHRAFSEWQAVSSARFVELPYDRRTDIVVAFLRGKHNDAFPFDGRDGIVAHAFYPRDGRLHFDADEDWTLNSDFGVNLYQTAVHEIGHLLGLEHSLDPRAAMFGSKRPYDPDFTLGDDDVRAVRELFPLLPTPRPMERSSTTTSSTTTTTTTPSTTTSAITTTTTSSTPAFEEYDQSQEILDMPNFFPFALPVSFNSKDRPFRFLA